jgi:hypothetical protein
MQRICEPAKSRRKNSEIAYNLSELHSVPFIVLLPHHLLKRHLFGRVHQIDFDFMNKSRNGCRIDGVDGAIKEDFVEVVVFVKDVRRRLFADADDIVLNTFAKEKIVIVGIGTVQKPDNHTGFIEELFGISGGDLWIVDSAFYLRHLLGDAGEQEGVNKLCSGSGIKVKEKIHCLFGSRLTRPSSIKDDGKIKGLRSDLLNIVLKIDIFGIDDPVCFGKESNVGGMNERGIEHIHCVDEEVDIRKTCNVIVEIVVIEQDIECIISGFDYRSRY